MREKERKSEGMLAGHYYFNQSKPTRIDLGKEGAMKGHLLAGLMGWVPGPGLGSWS